MPDIFVENKTPSTSSQTPTVSAKTFAPQKNNEAKVSLWHKIKQPLMAYVQNPVGLHFETQEETEEIVLLLRRHPVTNFPWIVLAVVMLITPALFIPLYNFLNPFPNIPWSYHLVLALFWYILTFSIVLVNYLHWYFNVYIVTNERIVDVDFVNMVYRQLASMRIAKVQDVTYKVNGVIRSIFDYGDVLIQSAGTEENFIFEAVPQPQQVVKKIEELIEYKEGTVPDSAQGV